MTARGLGGPFWRLWSASGVSALGDGFTFVALPLLAARLTRDPGKVALVEAAEYTAWLLFGLIAGALADRWERRRIMATTDAARVVLFGGFAAVAAERATLSTLLALAFLAGMLGILNHNTSSAYLPAVVRKDQLESANAWLQAVLVVPSSFLGPAVGGLVFVAAAALPFAVDSVSFLLSAVLVLSLRRPVRRTDGSPAPPLTAQIGEGLRWLWQARVLRVLCLLLALVNGTFAAVTGTLVLYAQDVLHLSERGYGLLLALIAVGALAGSALAPVAARTLGSAGIVRLLLVTQGVAMLAVALTGSLAVAAPAFVVVGLTSGLWNIATITLRQRIVPDRLLGRVTSAYRLVGLGAMPLGSVVGGLLARAYGLGTPLVVGGVLSVLGTAAAWRWLTAYDVAAALAGAAEEPVVTDPGGSATPGP